MGRQKKDEPKRDEAKICLCYARLKNFNKAARELGLHPETVRRIWDRLPEQKQAQYYADAQQAREIAREELIASEAKTILEYNRSLLICRDAALLEISRRLANAEAMKDHDIIAAFRLLNDVTTGRGEENPDNQTNNVIDEILSTIDEEMAMSSQ